MRRFAFALLVLCGSVPLLTLASNGESRAKSKAGPIQVSPADWPWWRGPNRNGTASPNQSPPRTWSETENVLWKSPIPGRGHGSPTVVGDQVFVAAAEKDREVQSVLCFDRRTGEQLWKSRLDGTFSSSPVMVGDQIYATNEAGRTFVFEATPRAFTLVAENQLGDEVFATPAICGDRIYMRVAAHTATGRFESLVCLGTP